MFVTEDRGNFEGGTTPLSLVPEIYVGVGSFFVPAGVQWCVDHPGNGGKSSRKFWNSATHDMPISLSTVFLIFSKKIQLDSWCSSFDLAWARSTSGLFAIASSWWASNRGSDLASPSKHGQVVYREIE